MDRVHAAVTALRRGALVVVRDATDREDEADLVLAASAATDDRIAFMVRHTSGIICAPMPPGRAHALELPPMVPTNTERHRTAFTVSVDAVDGTTTGISAADRGRTLRALAHTASAPADFARPGHVFPLRARPGGVLARQGHTEAAVDLTTLAGLPPVAVIAELVTADGARPADRAETVRFAAAHDLPTVTIEELAAYRAGVDVAPYPPEQHRPEHCPPEPPAPRAEHARALVEAR